MQRFYLSEGSYDDNEKNLLAMATDSWFGSPAAEVVKLHTKVALVFLYVLNERCIDLSYSTLFGGGAKEFLMLMILTAFFNHSQHLEASLKENESSHSRILD